MAGEAALATAFKDNILTCSICLEEYVDPRVLPCYHTYCYACLSDHAQRTGAVNRSFFCPLCREEVKFPEEGLDKFKKNFVLSKALELVQAQEGQGEGRCEGPEGLPDVTLLAKSVAAAELAVLICEKHPPNELKYYCEDDDVVVCADCGAEEHYRHGIIPLKAKASGNREKIKEVLILTVRKMNECEEAVQKVNATASATHIDNTISAIRDQMQILFGAIRQRGEQLITEATKAHAQGFKQNETLKDVLELHQVSVQSACNFAQQLVTSGSDSDIMTHTKSLTERLETLQRVPIPEPSLENPISLHFIPGKMSMEGLCAMLGRLSTHPDSDLSTDGATVSTQPEEDTLQPEGAAAPVIVEAPLNFLESAVMIHSLSAKLKDDSNDVNLTGITINGEFMYFLDSGNRRIKLYTHFGEFQFVIKLYEEPEDFAVSGNGDIYVTSSAEKCVSVYTLRGLLSSPERCVSVYKLRGLQKMAPFGKGVLEAPCGITMNREDLPMVCDSQKKAIITFDPKDGDTVNIIDIRMCSDPRYIAFNRQYNTIIVSDTGNYCIYIFSMVGSIMFTYGTYGCGDGQLYEPRGICTDKYGHIFVADWGNNRVVMLTPRGELSRYVATEADFISKPHSVGMNKKGELMVAEGGSKIRTFQYLRRKPGKKAPSAKLSKREAWT